MGNIGRREDRFQDDQGAELVRFVQALFLRATVHLQGFTAEIHGATNTEAFAEIGRADSATLDTLSGVGRHATLEFGFVDIVRLEQLRAVAANRWHRKVGASTRTTAFWSRSVIRFDEFVVGQGAHVGVVVVIVVCSSVTGARGARLSRGIEEGQ